MLSCDGEDKIIYHAELLLANERENPPLFYVMFQPIFDPRMKDRTVDIADPVLHCMASWDFDMQGISFTSTDGADFRLEKLSEGQRGVFEEWEQRLLEGEGGVGASGRIDKIHRGSNQSVLQPTPCDSSVAKAYGIDVVVTGVTARTEATSNSLFHPRANLQKRSTHHQVSNTTCTRFAG